MNVKPENSDVVRNRYGPRADKLKVCLPITEGAGAVVNDLGIGNDIYGAPWQTSWNTTNNPEWIETKTSRGIKITNYIYSREKSRRDPNAKFY